MEKLLLECKKVLEFAKNMADRENYDTGIYERTIKNINKSLHTSHTSDTHKYSVRNSVELTIWCKDLDAAKKLWIEVYMPDGWEIKESIKVRWNWKIFDYEYRFKLMKPKHYFSELKI